jgi:hypothetical protein
MNGFKWCVSWFAVLFVSAGAHAYGASILTLNLNPATGLISGSPGQTPGWGYTLANSSDNFALITSADFCGAVISSPCSTPLGLFTDFIAQFNFTLINPHSSLSAVFNPIAHTGIGSYAVSPSAPPGSSFLGQVVLTYDTYSDSSLNNQIGFDDRVTTAASVSVPPSLPEPSSLWLLPVGFAGLYLAGRRWKRA